MGFFWFKNKASGKKPFETSAGSTLANEELCGVAGPVVHCEFSEAPLQPGQRLEMEIYLTVAAGAPSAANTVSVSEGGVSVASTSVSDVIDPEASDPVAPPFGPSDLVSEITGVDGLADTQAGGHPYGYTTRIDFNTEMGLNEEIAEVKPTVDVGNPRDVVVDLPVGFVGDALSTPKCTFGQLQAYPESCPRDTIVGHITTEPHGLVSANSPIYNMVAEHGVAAEFGFRDLLFTPHVIDANVVPSADGYVLQAVAKEIPELDVSTVTTTFYGDPSAGQQEQAEYESGETDLTPITQVPMFSNPAACTGEPLRTKVYADSWQHPGSVYPDGAPEVEGEGWASAETLSPAVTGCDALRFTPSAFSVQPEATAADSPAGLSMDLQVAQSEQPGTLAIPPLRDTTITLPAGLIANPAAASGLVGCSIAQIGWVGHSESELTRFTPEAPTCPNASKLGLVEVVTPVLEKPLVGALYLANQNKNPFHSILAGYIVIDDPTTGVIVKIAGKLTLDPHTGQITGVFNEAPQTPFSELKLRAFGGSGGTGEFATPETCGNYTTSGLLTPWSAPESGPPASVLSGFQINSGCTPPFAPAFSAGTATPQAGSYSPFVLSFSRQDNEQEISGLTVSLPPGVSAKIAGVAKCPEADLQAAANNPSGAAEIANPACPAASEVGTVQAGSGVGTSPLFVPGKAYLTGPYKGAPLGLAVIVPAIAGPFDLGNVVVRSALYINPNNAQVTAVSDPFPTILDATGTDGVTDGFPIRMRSILITLNRNSYTLNPTNCNPMTVAATFSSTTGTVSSASSRFQAAGCRELPFKPAFTVSTQGHASKANGASLHVRVTSLPGQANIAKVHTELPKQLPSWLPTLQKACLAPVFEANPAACPPGSLVGTATAISPLIATPFTGPAYLVSHGAAAFPDLEIVLQSENITLILDGKTDIKHGITISNFETVPDAPVSSFELTLPTGPNHVLATNIPEKLNHNLCGQKLTMPTRITGQNGGTIQQTTKITITGCTKPKKQAKHKTTHKNKNNKKH